MFDDDVLDSISVSIFEFIKRHGDKISKVSKFSSLLESDKELFRALSTDILAQIDDPDLDYEEDDDTWTWDPMSVDDL